MEQTPPTSPPHAEPNAPPAEVIKPEDRTAAMLAHLTAIAGYIFPFGNIIGPLVDWLIKKDQSPFVDDQGKESVNFQITMTILYIIAAILVLAIIGIVLLPLLALLALIFVIVASVKANGGERYRYPFNFRMIR